MEPSEIFAPANSEKTSFETAKQDYEREIQKLMTTINYFTATNNQRIDQLAKTIDTRIRRGPIIENILLAVALMFKQIYNDGSVFTASLLVPEGETLKTWLTKSSCDSYDDLEEQLTEVDRGIIFGLNGNSLASKSWRHNKALSANTGIVYLFENQDHTLKSIIAIPIECRDELYLRANDDIYKVDKVVAILCVSSSNGSVFSKIRCNINSTILAPFISMINLQYSLRVVDTIIKGTEK